MLRQNRILSTAGYSVVLLLLLLLAACGVQQAASNEPAATATPTNEPTPAATATSEPATPTNEPTLTATATSEPATPTSEPATPTAAVNLYQGAPQGFTEEGAPALGPADAPVTLVDYSDFLCGVCKRHAEEVEPEIVANYVAPGQVRMVFRPVLNHGQRSLVASEAAMCAAQQDQFWAMHKLLFEHQQEIFDTAEFDLRALMSAYSRELGLDQAAFSTCMSSGEMAAQVQAWDAEQRERGITIQPIFEIDGQRLVGAQPFETFQSVIEGTLESDS